MGFGIKVFMKTHAHSLVETGIRELDDILGGGLTANRVYLVHGTPGAGKTTLALQYLLEGAKHGEKVLYITLSETKKELEAVAASHGWSLEDIDIFELVADEKELQPENQYTVFQPSEVELNVTTRAILGQVDLLKPSRIIIDSLSEVKLLAQNPLRFRRQVLALKQFFTGRKCTVFFLDDKTIPGGEDLQLESIAHGVLNLEQLSPEYGAERRRLRITKMRGQKYRGGYHDFSIIRGGLTVFPRIIASEHTQESRLEQLKSGLPELDALMGGGIDLGTSVLLLGPAGAGKSSLSMQYAVAAAAKGEHSVIFTFDERLDTLLMRAEGLGMPLKKYIQQGLIKIQPIDPTEMAPGEFAHTVRKNVEPHAGHPGAKIVIIDSLNGYLNAMPEERFLTSQMHELLTYLGHKNVVTFLVVAQHGLLGNAMQTSIDASYLADVVILFRYFEAMGEVKQAISVVKKRSGKHERTIREYKMGSNGIKVGEPLKQFHGILTGTPILKETGDMRLLKTDAA
jgi:circadian clock protein KaiC